MPLQESQPEKIRLALFFTWDVSLALWKEKGLLAREIRLYEELAKNGIEIVFLSWGGQEDIEIAKTLPKSIKVVPLYRHIPRPKNKALRALCSLLLPFKLRGVLKSCDIYKTNQMWGGWCAALSKLFYRKPLIVRCGFELYDFTCKQGHGALRRFFIGRISSFTYGMADQICVATQNDLEFIKRVFFVPEHKIHVHPNWIDTDIFKPQELEKKAGHILYVGRLSAQKNLESLIEAVANTDWTLDIVGEGELKQALQKRAQGASVNFLGALPNDQLPALYNAYPVTVLPSHYEGNPKTLLEAMACGAAVLGTNVPGIQNVIKDGRTGILCDKDTRSIRAALDKLMPDKALQSALGRAARDFILENQTLEKLVRRELALYEGIKDKTS